MTEKRALICRWRSAIVANALLYAVVVFPLGRQVASAEEQARQQRDQLGRARQDYQRPRPPCRASSRRTRRCRSSTRTSCRPIRASRASSPSRGSPSSRGRPTSKLEHGTNAVKHAEGQPALQADDDLHAHRRLPRRAQVHLLARDGARVHRSRERRAVGGDRRAAAARAPVDDARDCHLLPVRRCWDRVSRCQRPRPVILGLLGAVLIAVIVWMRVARGQPAAVAV